VLQPSRAGKAAHVIKPSLHAYLDFARAAAIPFLALGLGGIVRLLLSPHSAGLFGVTAVLVVPPLAAVGLHLGVARIGWDETHAWKDGVTGRRTILRADIEGIAFRSVSAAVSVQSIDKMVVYGRTNRVLMTVYCAYWSISDLREFEAAIGASAPDRFAKRVSQREFNREFPSGGSWFGRHPNLVGIVGALLIMLIICLGIALVEP